MANNKKIKISTLGSRMTSVISVALVLTLIGLIVLGAIAGSNGSKMVKANMGFIVKLDRTLDSVKVADIYNLLSHQPFTRESKFTSADDILAEESKYLGEDILAMTDINPYCSEIEVFVTEPYAVTDSLTRLAGVVSGVEGVDSVLVQTNVLKSVETNLNHLGFILMLVAVALLLISVVLINNTVYLSVYSRRFTINTMRLVGATGGFICRPFIRAGAVTGLVSALVAVIILIPLRIYLRTIDPAVDELISDIETIMMYFGLIILGVLICAVASGLAAVRYLRLDYDDMFK